MLTVRWIVIAALILIGIIAIIIAATMGTKNKKKEDYEGSYFDGSTLQLIGWNILATLVTVITFGIAFPWAVCMLQRWEIKHTVINGRRLKFTGKGIQLFGKYIVWALLTIITLGIYSIWFGLGMKKWVVKHTVFADDDSETESRFTGGAGGWFINYLLIYLVTVITVGIATPWAIVHNMKWQARHTVINGARLKFSGTGGQLFVKNLLCVLFTPLTIGIYALLHPVRLLKWQYSKTYAVEDDEDTSGEKSGAAAAGIIAGVLVLVLAICAIGAFLLGMPMPIGAKKSTTQSYPSQIIGNNRPTLNVTLGESESSSTPEIIPELTEKRAKELVEMSNVTFLLYHFESAGLADENKSYELFTMNDYYVTCYAAKGIDTIEDLENYLLKYFTKDYAKDYMDSQRGYWRIENGVIYFEPNYAMGSNSMSTENIIIKDLGDNKYTITSETEWSGPRTIYVSYEDGDYKLDLFNGKTFTEPY